MLDFLIKGLLRDRSRTLVPLLVVTIGVFFVVVLEGVVTGMMNNMVDSTAKHQTGHIKITTKAYLDEYQQKPLDLALSDLDEHMKYLNNRYAQYEWCARIHFEALLDIPDTEGGTKAQGPVVGTAYDLLSGYTKESERMELEKAIIHGRTISHNGEVLVSSDFAEKYDMQPNEVVTLFGSDVNGAMVFRNLNVAGIIRFGIKSLDQGAVIIDMADAAEMLDMDNATTEILGFAHDNKYNEGQVRGIVNQFNSHKSVHDDDEYAPIMQALTDQNSMDSTLSFLNFLSLLFVSLIIIALSIVLWNTGVIGGIRRYGEFGVRLAIGENKNAVYASLLIESFIIGVAGSVIGTALGLGISRILQIYGLDYSALIQNSSMVIEPILRSSITSRMCFIGFIPGVISMLVGSALAGTAILNRDTANLFNELE